MIFMNNTFKKIDSWAQLVMIAAIIGIAPFILFIVTIGYVFIGAWQLISSILYLLAGSSEEKSRRKYYLVGIIIYIIVCFACFAIKPLAIATIYLLWFVPAFFAVYYCIITVKEANIWPFQRLKP